VRAHAIMDDVKTGDSVAVDGTCLTVTRLDRSTFTVFASAVTVSLTTLASRKAGSRVNLERALCVGGRFGGHIVQGHVDGKGEVLRSIRDERGLTISIGAPSPIMHHLVSKGSVAVNGVSLTVVSEDGSSFELYLIPETLDRTTLPDLRVGDEVNIESDILAKYCEKLLGKSSSESDIMQTLGENGFL
ncbi:MAG TPA: riboflavin synthase, partial [Spirochaetota bacterium]